jgi:hypothetical protein
MRKIGAVLVCLTAAVIVAGCAKPPVQIKFYEPVITSPNQEIEVKNGQKAIEYFDNDYAVSASMVGSQGIMVVSLRIACRTGKDIKPDEYTIELADGRDLKPLKLISREVVMEYRKKLSTGQEIKTGNGMLDLALTQFSGIIQGMGNTELSQFLKSVDWAVDHYFAFRTIYVNEPRGGVLCYYADFILEYPLTLRIKLRQKQIDLQFKPS